MRFFLVISVFALFIIGTLFYRYGYFLKIKKSYKFLLFFLYFAIGYAPVLTGYGFEKYLGSEIYFYYRYFLYFLYIVAIVFVCCDIFIDFILFFINKFKKDVDLSFNKRIVFLLFITFLLSFYSLYEGIKVPKIKNIDIVSSKIKQDKKFILLPDLHLHRVLSLSKLKGIIEVVNAQKPDAVLLVGDIVDDKLDRLKIYLDVLKQLKATNGVYFVSGNHEVIYDYENTLNSIKNLGFIELENKGKFFSEDLFIAGVPDLMLFRNKSKIYDLDEVFSGASDNQFKLLLSHRPLKFKKNSFDLMVSGHTHGGQVFPFMIFVYLALGYVSGLYDLEDEAKLYVSRGAGQWGPQMRFLAPSEITVVNLKSGK